MTSHFGDTFVRTEYRRWLRGASLTTPKTFVASTTATLITTDQVQQIS